MLAAGLLALAASGCGGGESSTPTTTTTESTTTVATTETRVTSGTPDLVPISIAIEGGKPVGGIKRATVNKGSTVELVVHSDVADEIHVHGYDLKKDVDAGGTATISFTADIPGVFEAELEDAGLEILQLTVE